MLFANFVGDRANTRDTTNSGFRGSATAMRGGVRNTRDKNQAC